MPKPILISDDELRAVVHEAEHGEGEWNNTVVGEMARELLALRPLLRLATEIASAEMKLLLVDACGALGPGLSCERPKGHYPDHHAAYGLYGLECW